MTPKAFLAMAATAALLSGCGGGGDAEVEALKERVAELEQSPATLASPPTPPPPSPAAGSAPPAVKAPAVSAPAEALSFTMPDFRGVNLQDAQDQVQELGVFFSRSHDLLGTRSQVLDGNWQVCGQTPAAGTRIAGPAEDWEGKIDFGAVKLNERCP